MTTDRLVVLPRHVQSLGYCLKPGAQNWIECHGLSWRMFIEKGIPVELLEGIDDYFAKKMVQLVKKEAEK